jgi:hypothetical protein
MMAILQRSATSRAAAADVAPASRQWLRPVIPVAILLLMAIAVRLQSLPGGGPISNDEGWAISNGRYLLSLITHPGNWGAFRGMFSPGLTDHRHHLFPLGNDWKLGHDLMIGILSAAGTTPENLTWFSALLGVVMVIVLAVLAWRRWGAPAGAVAGVVAASIPLSVAYGHRIQAEADGMAAVAVLLYLLDRCWAGRPSKRLVGLTVVTLLASLTLSYRFLPTLIPIVVVAALLGWWYRNHSLPPRPSAGRLIAICLSPALILVSIYLLVFGANALRLPGLPHVVRYWFVRSSSGGGLPFAFGDFYPHLFWDYVGPVLVVAVILALLVLVYHWRKLDPIAALALGSLAGTFLFFSAAHDKAPRVMVICIPFAAIVLARAVTLLRNQPLQWAVALVVCIAGLASGVVGASGVSDLSGTGAVGRWLASHPGPLTAHRPLNYLVYVEQQRLDAVTAVNAGPKWEVLPGNPAHRIVVPVGVLTIADLRQDGVRWAVVDADGLYYGEPFFKQLVACGQPTVEFADPAGWSRLQFLEVADSLHIGYDGVLARRDQALATSHGKQIIRIYDLQGPGTAQCN